MKRDLRIDSIRGILLIVMTIDHFGGELTRFTDQSFGYASALTGFILLSGFLCGRVYGAPGNQQAQLWRKSAARAWLIYRYHVLLLLLVPVLLLSPLHAEYLDEFVRPFTLAERPVYYGVASLLLLHQPVLMDILPAYVVFMALSPPIILALRRGQTVLVLSLSILFWLLSRYLNPDRLLSLEYCDGCRYGYLNLLSWQLVWVVGVCIGYPGASGRWSQFVRRPVVLGIAFAVAIILFLKRHGMIDVLPDAVTDMNSLSPVRLLNLFALLVLSLALLLRIPRHWQIPGVSLIGRYSLQVFAFHVLLAYLLLPYSPMIIAATGEAGYVIFTLLVVGSLILPALWQRHREQISHG